MTFPTLPLAQRLSYETLGQIFLVLVDLSPDWARLRPLAGPLALTGVCASWRVVALSLPMLWNSLVVDFLPPDNHRVPSLRWVDSRFWMAYTWLARGRSLGLCLDLKISLWKPTVEPKVEILLRHFASSLDILRLSTEGSSLSSERRNVRLDSPSGYPRLRELDLAINNDFQWPPSFTIAFPRLERLSFRPHMRASSSYKNLAPADLPIENWGRITHLRLDMCGEIDEMCKTVENCPQLRGLHLAGFGMGPPSDQPLSLPSLTLLNIETSSGWPLAPLLRWKLPKLRTLSLGEVRVNQPQHMITWIQGVFQSVPFERVTSFAVAYNYTTPNFFELLLPTLPRMRRLRIPFDADFCSKIVDTAKRLPLEQLCISVGIRQQHHELAGPITEAMRALTAALHAGKFGPRMSPAAIIFLVECWYPLDPEPQARVDQFLRDAGQLGVTVHTGQPSTLPKRLFHVFDA
ncbi:hypothetical protein MIND_00298300 [Mycena indigotica]|uniref:F-box domain-containing protein n=1 Tax=Mycena indigotica TaxID=2126181 RepID=A0A8H6T4I4_9AGAR|nr:uncharacterized protein MIND_00298300 [Mycena indigotica]KAF7309280.1 hypothetical protein MIND_00298300 [Mycena indigotica]